MVTVPGDNVSFRADDAAKWAGGVLPPSDIEAVINALALRLTWPLLPIAYNDKGSRTTSQFAFIGDTGMGSTKGLLMVAPGSIRAHSLMVKIDTATDGDVTFEVRVDNVNQPDLELEFLAGGGVGLKSGYEFSASGSSTFSAGQFLSIRENETGDMAWSKMIGVIWIELDPE